MTATQKTRAMVRHCTTLTAPTHSARCSPRSCVQTFFFFSSRRRHTRFDCDWSSDVCSSDLNHRLSYSRHQLVRPFAGHSVGHDGVTQFVAERIDNRVQINQQLTADRAVKE